MARQLAGVSLMALGVAALAVIAVAVVLHVLPGVLAGAIHWRVLG